MQLKKQQKLVSIKQLVLNFETLFREVRLGRTIRIRTSDGPGCLMLPIGAKERVAFRRRTMKIAKSPNKPAQRW